MRITRRISWPVRAWLSGAALLLAAPLLPAGAQNAPSVVEEVGRMPVYWPANASTLSGQGTMMFNTKSRRAYQIFRTNDSRMVIQAVSLDTFKLLGSQTYPFLFVRPCTGCTYIGEYIHAVDEDRDRLYVAYGEPWTGIAEIDGTSLRLIRQTTRTAAFQPQVDPNNPCTSTNCVPMPVGVSSPVIRGISFVPAISSPASRDKLLLLLRDDTSSVESVQNLIWVSQWDVQTMRQDWLYRVATCANQPLPNTAESRFQNAVFQSPNGPYIYVGCVASGSTGQVVRLDQDGTSRPISDTGYPGPRRLTDVLADPEADRMLLRVSNEEGESFWVFDGPSSSYTGVIGTAIGSAASGVGLDETTGRLYVLTQRSVNGPRVDPGGLFLADARRSPAPQAIVFPQFTAGADYKIKVDPATDDRPARIFLITKLDFDKPRGEQAYRVIKDDVEVSVDPPDADQDRFTADEVEQPGVTETNFTGTAHAYGFRAVLVGGLEGASPVRSSQTQVLSPCLKPDRELVVGRVRRAALSNNLASASSIASDAEAVTRTDLQEPVNRCNPRGIVPALQSIDALSQQLFGPYLKQVDKTAGREWPFKESECSGDETATNTEQNLPGFTAVAKCIQSKQEIEATGIGNGYSAPAGLRIADAYTSVKLSKVAGRGLVVRSEAWVRGIEFPNVFTIDSANTSAEAFAAGRTGTAGTTFKRAVCGVRIFRSALSSIPAAVLDELPSRDGDVFFEGCFDPFTQIARVGTQTIVNNQVTDRPVIFLINRALGSRGRIRVPDPDAELAKGTPGGYLASIQKNRGEEMQARAISNDASTEVPAFELITFNDDATAGRGRQLYQFAGVDASSTYGIFLPRTLDFEDFGESISEDDTSLTDLLVDLTGGFPDLDVPTIPTQVLGEKLEGPKNVIAAGFNKAISGLNFLARSPREAALASVVWLLLGLPLYISSRRRVLQALRNG